MRTELTTNDYQHPVKGSFKFNRVVTIVCCIDESHPTFFDACPACEASVRLRADLRIRVREKASIRVELAKKAFLHQVPNHPPDFRLELRVGLDLFGTRIN